ncbi:MAG: hypothetical protein KC502_12180 [Myxococcales bacterium]|nr:hypothetical protein [Myxococcales bacterium]
MWRYTVGVTILAAGLVFSGCSGDDGGGGAGAGADNDTTASLSDTPQADVAQKGDTQSSSDGVATDAQLVDAGTADTGGPPSKLKWFSTCGDPVCGGWKTKPNVQLCASEKLGAACSPADGKCDPKNSCNSILVCTDKDPKQNPGGCPISARRFKKAIAYLDEASEAGLRDQLLTLPLASWQYKQSPTTRRSLGYILDDAPKMPATDLGRERVDVYALTTMAIAALKTQQRELHALRQEVAELKRTCRP